MNAIKELKNIKSLCRVCLTESKNMILLTATLKKVGKEIPRDISLIEALQEIVGRKINWGEKYPNVICSMCLDLLEISYSLKIQFRNSEMLLLKHFRSTLEPFLSHDTNQNTEISLEDVSKEHCPVQLIVGSNNYNLKDILIVEDEKPDQDNFRGFLDNLGKSITAKFVEKSKSFSKTLQEEKPVVLIEKLRSQTKKTIKNVLNPYDGYYDQFIITEDSLFTQNSNETTLKETFNFEKMGLQNISNADLELFQSALKMQLKCSICNKLYSCRGRLRRHLESCTKLECKMVEEDETGKTISLPLILKCHICTRIFKEKKFLNYHIKTVHHPEKFKYKCEICGQILRNKNTLNYHKMTKHGERKFVCGVCNKKFFTSSCLKTHVSSHSKKQIVQCVCPICGKTFHYKGGLFYHMKQHTNERKYCCDYCDRKFYTLNAKKRHTLTHTGIRPYPCRYCGKCFFSTGEVRKHEYIHTRVRPYSCPYCKKGFSSSYNMKVHLISHPGAYSCSMCDKTFISMDVLHYHHKTKHSLPEEVEEVQPN